jgi:hypothetical protein
MRKPLTQADLQKEIDTALAGRDLAGYMLNKWATEADDYLARHIMDGVEEIRAHHQDLRDSAHEWVAKKDRQN